MRYQTEYRRKIELPLLNRRPASPGDHQSSCDWWFPMPDRREGSPPLAEAINIALHCAKCGELFTIALRPTHRKPPDQPEKVTIACPYPNCDGDMHPLLYADVLGVWPGDGPEGVARAKRIMAEAALPPTPPALKREA